MRVNALANPEVGKFLNEHFVSSFQKVATFKITANGQKQGGNVASYFCAPDGRVLHCVAGPLDAASFLREAQWVVATTKNAIAESKGDGAKFKAMIRTAHAQKLLEDTGLKVEPITYDWQPPSEDDALQFRDPTGRPLAPKLPPPPIDGPDVKLQEKDFNMRQANAAKAPAGMGGGPAAYCMDKRGRRWNIGNQGSVHQIMAAHSMAKIENVYGTIFENILGEKISTKPVEIATPFPWRPERNLKKSVD